MKYPGKTAGVLALFAFLVSATVVANENPEPVENPEAVSGKSRSKGIRHLFINKPAIAERARARLQSRPKQPHPHAGRGFLLEKVQGGSAKGKVDLAKLRQRQLDQVEGRPVSSYPTPKADENKIPVQAHKMEPQATAAGGSAGFGSVAAACIVAALFFLVLRWRRGHGGSRQKKKKADGLC